MDADQARLEEARVVMQHADCLVDAVGIEAAISRMAKAITERLADSNPMVYVVMNGGIVLAGRLLPKLDFPLELGYLHATRYGHQLAGNLLDWRVRPMQDLRNRSVLVLDDILDEGQTLLAILDHLKAEGAHEVLSGVLVHKQHQRKARPDLRADFTGLDVADRYLFGSGMDYKGYWRNADGIFAPRGL